MVGLSVVLESQKDGFNSKPPQVINKTAMNIVTASKPPPTPRSSTSFSSQVTSSFPLPAFLEQCFLCGQKLLPGKDIYMYKGDRAFCTVECRCKQIVMDEEETLKKGNNCSLMASIRPTSSNSAAAASSSPGSSRHRKVGIRNRVGGFAC